MAYFTISDRITIKELKHYYVLYQLQKHGGNKSKSAKILGISRSTLREILASHDPQHVIAECTMCSETTKVIRHHVIPKKEGGTDNTDNLALLCHRCHNRLHKKFLSPVIDSLKSRQKNGRAATRPDERRK